MQNLPGVLILAIVGAVLGMVQFGYNTGVLNAPQEKIEDFIRVTMKDGKSGADPSKNLVSFLFALVVSLFAIGGMIGGLSGGYLADKFGRRSGLLLNNVSALIGVTLMVVSKSSESIACLIIGRFFIGLNCGANCALVPMYLSEIAPVALRGTLGTLAQLGVTIGLLMSQILGLPYLLGTETAWPTLLALAYIPAIIQLISLPICPESPRYLLITKGKIDEAREALKKLRSSTKIDEEVNEIECENRANQQEESYSVLRILQEDKFRMPLMIAIIVQFSQQLSGINAIFYYSTFIFMDAGLSQTGAQFATIAVGVIMVVVTLISVPLMDRVGRRSLMLWGLGGMIGNSLAFTIFLLLMSVATVMSYAGILSALSFVVFFAIGPGSIPWLITAELFSQGPRSAAMSIAVLVNWSTNFLVGLSYPLMQRYLSDFSFLPFTILMIFFWIFIYKKVPETKNRSIEEITAIFERMRGGNYGTTPP
ncbi:glucose transporter type 1-like [Brevipalpus obovatus]|uniref:glucose transporter type 1-like n=1 Tax=Brevipalpus obovatus TaxID=246614 RepID=UPI003D9F2C62